MATLTMKDMLDAGVHFGHQTQRWNPKMKPYVFTSRGGIHIIDLQQTVEMTKKALEYVREVGAQGGKMIFVGTKKQAIEPIQEVAKRSGQYYVTKRWLGGTLTNFVTIKQSIDRMKKIDQMKEKGELEFFTKKERSRIDKEYGKLNDYLEGIRDMKEAPQLMFVVDITKEHIAVDEAKRLGIKVVGMCDTNSDPEAIDFPIPGNDDAIRSIKLFSGLVADAFLEGAALWDEKVRNLSDKQSDTEKERPARAIDRKAGGAAQGDRQRPQAEKAGPSIVKASKARKLVAAGTAEDVEILAEVEAESEKKGDDDATPETTPENT